MLQPTLLLEQTFDVVVQVGSGSTRTIRRDNIKSSCDKLKNQVNSQYQQRATTTRRTHKKTDGPTQRVGGLIVVRYAAILL